MCIKHSCSMSTDTYPPSHHASECAACCKPQAEVDVFAEHRDKADGQKHSLWRNARVLLSNPEAVPFFAMSLLMGFGVGVLYTYLFLYLDELGEPLQVLQRNCLPVQVMFITAMDCAVSGSVSFITMTH